MTDINNPFGDSDVVRANYPGLTRKRLHDILGHDESSEGGRRAYVPIAEPETNGEARFKDGDPAASALLAEITAAIAERTKAFEAWEKAQPKAEAAQRDATRQWQKVRDANTRALRLRAVLDDLRKVRR